MRILILAVLMLIPTRMMAAELLAGPMISHTTTSSAIIWVETDAPAKVTVDYWTQTGRAMTITRAAVETMTSESYPHTGTITLNGFMQNTRVHYAISVNGKQVRALVPQVFRTMPAMQPRRNDSTYVADFSVGFGSCLNPGTQPMQPAFSEVLQHRPNAFLFIGDINYMPGRSSHYGKDPDPVRYAMAGYHREVRHVPEIRALMATTPSYGIWDDHDYGPNNSDRTFSYREETLELYRRYWPNSGGGTSQTKGIFHKFRISDVEFFMLDDRYHRDPNEAEDRKTMFGQGQIDWLKASLKASTATFKVIANGNSMVVDFKGRGERWDNFGTERDDFLKWMFAEGITGVVFIAGDWHVGTLNRLYREGQDTYPLFELLSSNAAVRTDPIVQRPRSGWRGNPQSIATVYPGFNFGLLNFSGPKGNRQLNMKIVDKDGNVQIKYVLQERDLR